MFVEEVVHHIMEKIKTSTKRIYAIDITKFICSIAVVYIHITITGMSDINCVGNACMDICFRVLEIGGGL